MHNFTTVLKAVTATAAAIATLQPGQQDGSSTWGTLRQHTFPDCLTNNPMPNGYPWGTVRQGSTTGTTHIAPFADLETTTKEPAPNPPAIPNTGVTRTYNLTVARGRISPDGYQRDAILINGQLPGPLIEANWGDWIQVTVNNQISGPSEGTSMHWHGMLQNETPWYDGVPSVQQCPIAPGSSFTYRFRATLYGTSWYHTHYSAQYSAGAVGPMIIYGPKDEPYDIDLGPVLLSDWYHDPYFKIVQAVVGTDLSKLPPKSDNNLINGKMFFNCSTVAAGDKTPCTNNADISKFRFTKGKIHRLRLVNTGADGVQKFSIDNHVLTVIAVDYVPIKPYTTSLVTLGVGQRTDILVNANAAINSAVWMRSSLVNSTECGEPSQPYALAAIYYDKADPSQKPKSTSAIPQRDLAHCANDELRTTVPTFPIRPPPPTIIQNVTITLAINATGHAVWEVNNHTFRGDYNNPALLLAKLSQPFPPDYNAVDFSSNSSIRVVVENGTPFAHPMHLHGHNMYILHEGAGPWDGTSFTRPENPTRRDTQIMRGNGHVVWQIDADNPGVWPFHCHIAWHLSGGLYMNVLERPKDIIQMEIPQVVAQTCRDWAAYTNTTIVDQIDSGL